MTTGANWSGLLLLLAGTFSALMRTPGSRSCGATVATSSRASSARAPPGVAITSYCRGEVSRPFSRTSPMNVTPSSARSGASGRSPLTLVTRQRCSIVAMSGWRWPLMSTTLSTTVSVSPGSPITRLMYGSRRSIGVSGGIAPRTTSTAAG